MVSNAGQSGKLPRSEVDPAKKWDLTQLFKDDAAVSAAFAEIEAQLPAFAPFNGHIADSAESLLAYLRFSEDVEHKFEKLALYTYLLRSQDASNAHASALATTAEKLGSRVADACAFANAELSNIDSAQLEAFIDSQPDLGVYRHFFANLALDREHIREEPIERLLAQSAVLLSGPSIMFKTTTQVVMPRFMPRVAIKFEDGKETEWADLDEGFLRVLLQSRERQTRKQAFEGVLATYAKFAPTLAANYIASVESQIFTARARNFKSVLEMKLSDPRLPVDVYDALITTARANRGELQRYLELRRNLLGVDKLHMYDLDVPLIPGFEQAFTYEQSKQTVLEALSLLGPSYVARLGALFEAKRVDVLPNEGKENGAFSASQWGYPGYLLLNFKGLLRDVFTLGHEGGHYSHSEEANGTQPFVYRDYPTFCAEIASIVNEQLITNHLLQTADSSQMRMHLLNQDLENFRGAVIRQAMFAEFERRVFKLAEGEGCNKTPLTLELLCDLYLEIVTDYYGPTVVIDELIKYEWLRVPHFVVAPFYVYAYATGMSAAIGLARNMIINGQAAVEAYFGFLRSGKSKFPLDALREAGIDMSKPEAIQLGFDYFSEAMDRMQAELALASAGDN
ncbi:MAG: oligoendopeptidase F [Cyanobacteria bacterium SZAS LIN-5]|nr:oligoendopeptidase F [Cyanobacteria bacterium SZAS LIN-5]